MLEVGIDATVGSLKALLYFWIGVTGQVDRESLLYLGEVKPDSGAAFEVEWSLWSLK